MSRVYLEHVRGNPTVAVPMQFLHVAAFISAVVVLSPLGCVCMWATNISGHTMCLRWWFDSGGGGKRIRKGHPCFFDMSSLTPT